jgi:hypothetical protein
MGLMRSRSGTSRDPIGAWHGVRSEPRAGTYVYSRLDTDPVVKALRWTGARLLGLTARGVEVWSIAAAVVALLVLPEFVSGLPRLWALLLLASYIIYALLRDEYRRVSAPCLTAQVYRFEDQRPARTFLEIHNCGSVTVEQVELEFPAEANWGIYPLGEYPISRLEPDERISVIVVITMTSDSQTRLTLKGIADGTPYQREKLVSSLGAIRTAG